MNRVLIFRTHEDAKLPTKSHETDQCFDFYSVEDVVIYPGETKVVDLGVRMVLPEGYGLEFRERSGLASKGVIVGAGVIDEGYHGPMKVVLRYMGGKFIERTDGLDDFPTKRPDWRPFEIKAGDRVVQGELVERIHTEMKEIPQSEFDRITGQLARDRGEGGFGSTGN